MADIHIGTSGWNYDHWKDSFYPYDLSKDKWLEHYQGWFDTVEVSNTFYNLSGAGNSGGLEKQCSG